jgi:adenosine deaminase
VRLLVSVDRGASLEDARETIDAAIEAFESQNKDHGIVVGVEMGGNPLAGDWSKLSKEFERARAAGLKVSLHFAENKGEEKEHHSILDFAPERVGHAVFMSSSIADRLASSKIPVEVRLPCAMDRKPCICIFAPAGWHWQARSNGSSNLFADPCLIPNVARRCA